jgi:NTP pyrophosphatase (non-canonical NTP hydrolase)
MNNLSPTLDSTILKAVEEAGELARAVLQFYKETDIERRADCLTEIVAELLDVAQTCVTMLFVLEDFYEIDINQMVRRHLDKLIEKKYSFVVDSEYQVVTDRNYKFLYLPRLNIDADIMQTMCKIQEELGELTQYIGKHGGASGEKNRLKHRAIIEGAAAELCDVAQCCFTMIYILDENYGVDIIVAQEAHVEKLLRKGYLTK